MASATGKIPRALAERPDPDELLQFYIDAFVILNDRRQSPDVKLSLSDIFLFADSVSENRIEFAKIIIAGDRAFFEANQEKAEMNRGIKQSD